MAHAASTFRPRRALFVLVLVAACSGSLPPTFTATFPAQPGEVDIDALPVSLVDHTGLVTALAVAPASGGQVGVVAEPGEANAVRVQWLGGACDGRVTAVLVEAGSGYSISIHVRPGLAAGFGCPAIGVPRAVTIGLSQPVEPARFTVSQAYP